MGVHQLLRVAANKIVIIEASFDTIVAFMAAPHSGGGCNYWYRYCYRYRYIATGTGTATGAGSHIPLHRTTHTKSNYE